MTVYANRIRHELKKAAQPERAILMQRYFRTGKGEYGEGDAFLGIPVPTIRHIIRAYPHTNVEDAYALLSSPWHEERFAALLLLMQAYQKAPLPLRSQIVKRYLASTDRINNWDLVDTTAHRIVGDFYLHRSREPLYALAKSKNIWKRRIAMISTFRFIYEHDLDSTFFIANILLHDSHDLIQKAVGWALREAGKRDLQRLRSFLKLHADNMPRTMLRYAIEKMSASERKKWLGMQTFRKH